MIRLQLTDFQAEEVEGLLGVCQDEAATSDDRTPWGEVEHPPVGWRILVVTDPADAIDDLRYRADYLVDEGLAAGSNGTSGARSLRQLADRIEQCQQSRGM